MAVRKFILIGAVALLSLAGCADGPFSFLGQRSASGPVTAAIPAEEYRLGIGDVISIRIYGGEEEFRLDRVRLNDAGTLTLPYDDFRAYGRTTRELEAAITESLKGKFLLKPRVWVNIEEYRPFFIQGQVGRPGSYPFRPGLNVRTAITIAGGLGVRAAENKIFLMRENDKTNTLIKVDLNTPVGPGDTIIVEESFF